MLDRLEKDLPQVTPVALQGKIRYRCYLGILSKKNTFYQNKNLTLQNALIVMHSF